MFSDTPLLFGDKPREPLGFSPNKTSIERPPVTIWKNPDDAYRWATDLALSLTSLSMVHSVELFGSLARGEATPVSDIDIIVIVDPQLASEWQEFCTSKLGLSTDLYDRDRRKVRFGHAANLLDSWEWLHQGWQDIVDIFLFPPNWTEDLNRLQKVGLHKDPMFMENIARDATPFDPETNSFPLAEFPRNYLTLEDEYA